MALALAPTKPTRKKGSGVCLVTRGKNKGKFRSCTKVKSGKSKGKWVARTPISKLKTKKRRTTGGKAPKSGCRKERVSKYGNVRCMTVCRKKGRVVSRTAASGCSPRAPRSRAS
jgi:hypothetical protein